VYGIVSQLTVVKEATPPNGTDFEFGELNGRFDPFFLDDAQPDDHDDLTDSQTLTNLTPGAYSVIELIPANWALLGVVCQDVDTGAAVAITPVTDTGLPDGVLIGATVPVASGQHVRCTFTNNKPNFEEEEYRLYLPLIVK
jgi:hypothetical protein